MILLALTMLNSGICSPLCCAVAGLIFAFFLIAAILRTSPGNARMQEIAGAVQEGAKAYLNRQVMTISVDCGRHFHSALFLQGSRHGGRIPDRRHLLARGRLHRHADRRSG